MTPTKDFATEGGHWYAKTGEPRYTIIGANGKERPTTLWDARKLSLVPSVTTITKILDRPGLKPYFRKQMFEASLTTPRPAGMTDTDFFNECCKWADEHASLAAAAGTRVHGEIEKYIQGKPVDPDLWQHVNHVEIELEKVGVDLKAGRSERSFAHVDGFGGKIDFSTDTVIVDFKTKPVIGDKQSKDFVYDEHCCQLAAYAHGMGIVAPRCLNVFVSVLDARVVVYEWNPVEIGKGLEMFKCCLRLWQLKNNYLPNPSA